MKNGIYIALLFLILFGCKKPEDRTCWKSHGETVTDTRTLAPFLHLRIEDHMQVELVEDSVQFVEIIAGENVVPFVETRLELDTLILSDRNKCSFLRSYKKDIEVVIHTPDLRVIRQYTTGNLFSSDTLHFPYLYFDGKFSSGQNALMLDSDSLLFLIEGGPSSFTLSGKTNYFYFYHSGNGKLDGYDLKAEHVHVNHTSSGYFRVHANQQLIAEMYGVGDLYYRGSVLPEDVVVGGDGSGTVIRE